MTRRPALVGGSSTDPRLERLGHTREWLAGTGRVREIRCVVRGPALLMWIPPSSPSSPSSNAEYVGVVGTGRDGVGLSGSQV